MGDSVELVTTCARDVVVGERQVGYGIVSDGQG